MADAVRSALARLQKSAAELNYITDLAAKTVREVEDFLAGCSLGGVYYAAFTDGEPDDKKGFLGYKRCGKDFRITIEYGMEADAEARPWSDCSRKEKLDSFAHLPKLLENIADEVDEEIEAAKSSVLAVGKTVSRGAVKNEKGAGDDN